MHVTTGRFVNDAAMLLGRNRTGLCAKCQRKVARKIKAARQLGLIPTISNHEIRDTGPGGLYAWAGKGEPKGKGDRAVGVYINGTKYIFW